MIHKAVPQPLVIEPDLKSALASVLELMAIPGTSGCEGQVQRYLVERLREGGIAADAIVVDDAHKKSPLPGEVGNLICQFPGTAPGPRRLLLAHMDTVPLCVGAKPVRKRRHVESADKTTGLGADNRAGCAVVLNTALEIARRGLPHPPLTLMWLIQEEVGLFGARFVKLAALGKPKLAFNWDGGPATKVTIGATGAYRLYIVIRGLASHAGAAPELGVSAISIAGLAIGELQRGGWLGAVRKGRREGTSNIGFIQGGGPTNVITDRVELKAEARSHDPQFRMAIRDAIQKAFESAAQKVKSVAGVAGSVEVTSRLDYESFQLSPEQPSVAAAVAAISALGEEPLLAVTNGGLDANWLTARGIPTVTLGCGQRNVHTVAEQLDVADFEQACRIALRLATA